MRHLLFHLERHADSSRFCAPTLPFDTVSSLTGIIGEFVGHVIELFGLASICSST